MVIFNSYVKLPEGRGSYNQETSKKASNVEMG
jgi:hypothetical protein